MGKMESKDIADHATRIVIALIENGKLTAHEIPQTYRAVSLGIQDTESELLSRMNKGV